MFSRGIEKGQRHEMGHPHFELFDAKNLKFGKRQLIYKLNTPSCNVKNKIIDLIKSYLLENKVFETKASF